jgi:hypothetical protein
VATEATKAATVGRREERKEEMLLIEKTWHEGWNKR